MAISHLTLYKSSKGRQAVPCGNDRNAPELSKRKQSFTQCPCIHPDPAAAEVRAGKGPLVGKENVGNGNSLTHAPKLNPEVVARVYCVGTLESKMRCGMSHGQRLQI